MHVCSSVLSSFHPEHVSLVACLLALHAGRRAVLDGSSLFSMLLPPSLWGSSPLDKALHSPARRDSLSQLKGLEVVPLGSGLSVTTSYTEAIAQVGMANWIFLGQDLASVLAAAPALGPFVLLDLS